MHVEANRWAPLETGGVLLGYGDLEGSDVVVVDVLGPGPRAEHGRSGFHPDSRWQAEQVAARYEASDRIVTYLGDWHSHPTSLPLPSEVDAGTARRIARDRAARASEPLMVILGRPAEDEWLLVGLRYQRRRLRPTRLRLFAD